MNEMLFNACSTYAKLLFFIEQCRHGWNMYFTLTGERVSLLKVNFKFSQSVNRNISLGISWWMTGKGIYSTVCSCIVRLTKMDVLHYRCTGSWSWLVIQKLWFFITQMKGQYVVYDSWKKLTNFLGVII